MSHYRKQVSHIFAVVGLTALESVSQAEPVVYFGTDPGVTSLGARDEIQSV